MVQNTDKAETLRVRLLFGCFGGRVRWGLTLDSLASSSGCSRHLRTFSLPPAANGGCDPKSPVIPDPNVPFIQEEC